MAEIPTATYSAPKMAPRFRVPNQVAATAGYSAMHPPLAAPNTSAKPARAMKPRAMDHSPHSTARDTVSTSRKRSAPILSPSRPSARRPSTLPTPIRPISPLA